MLAPEQLAKLKSELDIVQQNINVFSEMLTEITPGQEHPNDLELLQVSKYKRCLRINSQTLNQNLTPYFI